MTKIELISEKTSEYDCLASKSKKFGTFEGNFTKQKWYFKKESSKTVRKHPFFELTKTKATLFFSYSSKVKWLRCNVFNN